MSVAETISDGGSTNTSKFQALGFVGEVSYCRGKNPIQKVRNLHFQGKHEYDETMSKGKLFLKLQSS